MHINNTTQTDNGQSFFAVIDPKDLSEMRACDTSGLYQSISEKFTFTDVGVLEQLRSHSRAMPHVKPVRPGSEIRGLMLPLGKFTAPGLLILFYGKSGIQSGRVFVLTDHDDLFLLPPDMVVQSRGRQ